MNKLLSRYFQENFFIIPIRKDKSYCSLRCKCDDCTIVGTQKYCKTGKCWKRPLMKKWNQYPISYMETRQYIKEGYNIAVVAKDLWILDYDRQLGAPRIRDNIGYYRSFGTCIQFSPHGY